MVTISHTARIALLVTTLAVSMGSTVRYAEAATLTVNKTADTNDGLCDFNDCSLREALAVANQDTTPDNIVLPAGYYKLTNNFSSLSIEDPVTITGAGSGVTEVVGDEFGQDGYGQRMLAIPAEAGNVTLTGFTIRGGGANADGGGIHTAASVLTLNAMRVEDNTATGFTGGGIANGTGTLNVTSSTISGNSASFGAAIFNSGGTVTITSSALSENASTVNGGGIYNNGTLNVTASRVKDNTATNSGAGIEHLGGTATVTSSTLTGNTASSEGGAIHNVSGTVNLTASTLSGNVGASGGGIDNDASGNATVASSTLSENSAGEGGGINNTGAVTVDSSSLSRNTATDDGGALANSGSGSATLRASTLSGNSAGDGGGGIFDTSTGALNVIASTLTDNSATFDGGGISDTGGDAAVTSSIVIGNTATTAPDCTAGVATGGFNVVGATGGCPSTGTDDTTATDDSFLGPLANNGGPTETHTVAASSAPVGNAGTDPACDGTTTDQRGVPRPDNTCDSGAYQLVFCRAVVVNVVGTPANDTLAGTHGPDGILALGGRDKANGGDGNDAVCGGPGRDKLSGAAGDDTLDGGPGADSCIGGPGNDKFKACESARQ